MAEPLLLAKAEDEISLLPGQGRGVIDMDGGVD
jgi:hypothetical protein